MTKSTGLSLGEHFDQFVSAQIRKGRFESPSEVVRAGLRLLEERETKLSALRLSLEEGKRSGVKAEYSLANLLSTLDDAP